MNRKQIVTLAILLASGLPAASFGADRHGHDHAGHEHGPKHGGIVHEIGDIAGELVVKADTMTLHLFERDKPLAATGIKAEATVHASGAKAVVALLPAGENRLAATGSFKQGVGVRVAVVIALPGKPEVKLNFRLK